MPYGEHFVNFSSVWLETTNLTAMMATLMTMQPVGRYKEKKRKTELLRRMSEWTNQ